VEFCQVQNSLCVQVLPSILTALAHGTPAAGISQTLRLGTRNGNTELLQRAPPIFGWAAITLGIGPHFSCLCINILNNLGVISIGAGLFCMQRRLLLLWSTISSWPRISLTVLLCLRESRPLKQ